MFFSRNWDGMMDGGFVMGIGILGFIICLLLVTALVLIVVKLMRHRDNREFHMGGKMMMGDNSNHIGKALEILNERYAKGEIEDEEYLKKKAEMTKN